MKPTTLTWQTTFKGSLLGTEGEWESLGKVVKPQSSSVIKGSKKTQLYFLFNLSISTLFQRKKTPSLLPPSCEDSLRDAFHRHCSHKREVSTAAIFSQCGPGSNGRPVPKGPGESATTARDGRAQGILTLHPSPHPITQNSNLKVWSKNVNRCCSVTNLEALLAWEQREESKLSMYLLKVLKFQVGSLYWWTLVVWRGGGGGRAKPVLLVAHGALANTVSPWKILDHPLSVVCSRR